MSKNNLESTEVSTAADLYDGLLIDASGVLVYGKVASPGAIQFIDWLNQSGKPYLILTNSSISGPESLAQRYQDAGLKIPANRILNSGQLLREYMQDLSISTPPKIYFIGDEFAQQTLQGIDYQAVSQPPYDYFVILNQPRDNAKIWDIIESGLNALLQQFDIAPCKVILPNPDTIYPHKQDFYKFTAGAIYNLYKDAFEHKTGHTLSQYSLIMGKPYAPIFKQAEKTLGSSNLLMIGDQWYTDIKGSNEAGLDSLLWLGGVFNDESLLDEIKRRYPRLRFVSKQFLKNK